MKKFPATVVKSYLLISKILSGFATFSGTEIRAKLLEALFGSLMLHSHQGLNMFKSCLVEHSLKLFRSENGCFRIFVVYRVSTNESTSLSLLESYVKVNQVQLSVTNFHFANLV